VKNFLSAWTLLCLTCLGVGMYFNMSSSGYFIDYDVAAVANESSLVASRLAVADSTLPRDGLVEMGEQMWLKQSANLGLILVLAAVWSIVALVGALVARQ
jgi:hypothetical protein